uniref:Golgi SNAP receptor complex member 1 n=1 Tax=Ascaris lumbricoides TaxID=6252 RepID=A0A9J2PD09_ASCLU
MTLTVGNGASEQEQKCAHFGDYVAYDAMPTGSGAHQHSSALATNYTHYIGDAQRISQSALTTQSRMPKSKSIYEFSERKRNVKVDKACFAFLKFGDCHYGENCKFSHNPDLLNAAHEAADTRNTKYDDDNMALPLIYSNMKNSDATCRQLEQRLLQIQKELTMLEEESKKPKSSVVVPKRSQPLFPSADNSASKKPRSAFNVGGDFMVLVGNSRDEHENSQARQRSETRHSRKPPRHTTAVKGHSRGSDSSQKGSERNRVASSRNEHAVEVSGEESISNDEDDRCGTPLRLYAVSSSGEDEEDDVEPLEMAAVNSNDLIEISDDELPNDCNRHEREPSSLRGECSTPFVLCDSPIIYEKLPEDVIEQLHIDGSRDGNRSNKRVVETREQLLSGFEQDEFIERCTASEKEEEEEESFCGLLVDLDNEAEGTSRNLRKRARMLENSIDVKLVTLNKLACGISGRHESSVSVNNSKENVFNSLSAELEEMIVKLVHINDEMSEHIGRHQRASPASGGWASNPALQHTLRRHREILRDYSTEFNRSRDNVQNQLQRESLLRGGSDDASCLNNRLKPSDFLLKEQEHIASCDRLLDEQISIAMSAKEHTYTQRMTLRDISKKVTNLAKKYPLVNSVVQKIQMRKRKDTVILAAVVSACLILILLYLLRS